MANDDAQLNIPSLIVIIVVSTIVIRYIFFSPRGGASRGAAGGSSRAGQQQQQNREAVLRSREAAVERIQQMFPQVERRAVLWDLQRTGGNIAATTERILAGRMETPPITFQPPPPPGQIQRAAAASAESTAAAKQPDKPAQPDLITRYNLKDKLTAVEASNNDDASSLASEEKPKGKGAWSTNPDVRQSLLQKRRDEMIIQARKKMEAKIAAEKAKAAGSAAQQ